MGSQSELASENDVIVLEESPTSHPTDMPLKNVGIESIVKSETTSGASKPTRESKTTSFYSLVIFQ